MRRAVATCAPLGILCSEIRPKFRNKIEDRVPSGRRLQGLISSHFYPYPPPYAKYFLTRFTLISEMIKFDLSGADFGPRAEKLEPWKNNTECCHQPITNGTQGLIKCAFQSEWELSNGIWHAYVEPWPDPDPPPPPLIFFSHLIYTDLRDDQKIGKNRGIPRFRGKV